MSTTKYRLIRKNKETGKIWEAYCIKEDNGFRVKAGSIISNIELKRCPKKIKEIRGNTKISDDNVLIEDVLFDTLDDAAAFVLLTNAIGLREWEPICKGQKVNMDIKTRIEQLPDKTKKRIEEIIRKIELFYPEHKLFATDKIISNQRESLKAICKEVGLSITEIFEAYGFVSISDEEVKQIRNKVIYAPGNEPEEMKIKIEFMLKSLQEFYPSKVIEKVISSEHSSLSEKISGYYRWFGYEDRTAFLKAYGYEYLAESKGGAQKITDEKAIIQSLLEKYPNGAQFKNLDELSDANHEFASKRKTLANNANKYFGMSLSKYLKSIGLIKEVSKEETDLIKESTKKKTGLSNYSKSESEWLELLESRYAESKTLPTSIEQLVLENKDIPIAKVNKYICKITGDKQAKKYYIRQGIIAPRPTDFKEYLYCKAKRDCDGKEKYYISEIDDIKVGDRAIVLSSLYGETLVEILSVEKCLGIDAPTQPNVTPILLGKENQEKLTFNHTIKIKENHNTDEKINRKDDKYEEEYDLGYNDTCYCENTSIDTFKNVREELQEMMDNSIFEYEDIKYFNFKNKYKEHRKNLSKNRFVIIERVHGTANQESVNEIEAIQSGDILQYEELNKMRIKSQSGKEIGYIKEELSYVIKRGRELGFISSVEVKVAYVKPLSKMESSKRYPVLFVAISVDLENKKVNMDNCCKIAYQGYEMGEDTTMIEMYTVNIPLNIAEVIFELANQEYDGTFKGFCQLQIEKNSSKYKGIEPYLQNMDDEFYVDLKEYFCKYAVEKEDYYLLDGEEVDILTWEENTEDGFNNWCDFLHLHELNATIEDEMEYDYIDEIAL